jgi:putative PIN family toxin of toxin-antitoxin system
VRVFPDTNVLVAGLATRGLCCELLEHVLHDHELLICAPVLAELERVLAGKLRLPAPAITGFIALLKSEGHLVEAGEHPAIAIRDAADVRVLACAIHGKADVFVTGDRELLELRQVGILPIVSPRELWLRLMGIASPGKPG